MSWIGSIERNWKNRKTGERIEFRKRRGIINVWLMGEVNGRDRGSKIGESTSEAEAKQIALDKINDIGNERWFSRYE